MPFKMILQFEKTESVKYISQLDMLRAFHRALRRADIPIAYSEGYNPQPKISFAFALSVGLVSHGEYLEATLKELTAPEEFIRRMNAVLPKGLQFIDGCLLPPESNFSTGKSVNCASFSAQITNLSENADTFAEHLRQAASQEQVWIEKHTKKGVSVIDAKEGIYDFSANSTGENTILADFTLAQSEKFTIRADDFLKAVTKGTNSTYTYVKNNTLIKRDGEYISPVEYVRRFE